MTADALFDAAPGDRPRRELAPGALQSACRRVARLSLAVSSATVAAPAAASGASRIALTSADETITPSAKPATWAACAASEIPIPTQTGRSVVALIRRTSELAAALTAPRTPVTPISDEA